MERANLRSIRLRGYRSFLDAEMEFGDSTLLLGANGSGKSNMVSFFKMLNYLSTGALQEYIGISGGSNTILFYGSKTTQQIEADITFKVEGSTDSTTRYSIRLADAEPDTMIFTGERVSFSDAVHEDPKSILVGVGQKESRLKALGQEGDTTCKVVYGMVSRCRCYQFHDTSSTARIRRSGNIEDAHYLRSDAGNLAAYLHAMQTTSPDCYRRIVETIRLVLPSFGDFVLQPSSQNERYILLNWRGGESSDYLFGPHQLSDGALRFMALATLFLQPTERLPNVIIIDEPELGLHPYAISLLAGMVRSLPATTQVILATQSTRMVDEFEPEQIVIFEHEEQSGTSCKRLNRDRLSEWLADYSLSELWEKNHFGGRP